MNQVSTRTPKKEFSARLKPQEKDLTRVGAGKVQEEEKGWKQDLFFPRGQAAGVTFLQPRQPTGLTWPAPAHLSQALPVTAAQVSLNNVQCTVKTSSDGKNSTDPSSPTPLDPPGVPTHGRSKMNWPSQSGILWFSHLYLSFWERQINFTSLKGAILTEPGVSKQWQMD